MALPCARSAGVRDIEGVTGRVTILACHTLLLTVAFWFRTCPCSRRRRQKGRLDYFQDLELLSITVLPGHVLSHTQYLPRSSGIPPCSPTYPARFELDPTMATFIIPSLSSSYRTPSQKAELKFNVVTDCKFDP